MTKTRTKIKHTLIYYKLMPPPQNILVKLKSLAFIPVTPKH